MIINKETMIDAIRELGHVIVSETADLVLVRSNDCEVTIAIKPVYTGTTITRVSVAYYLLSLYEYDHDEREYKSLNGLIDYIMKHVPLHPCEIYACKNDRVAKNAFKQVIQNDIRDNALDYFNHDDAILVSTEHCHYSIKITVTNGEFNGEVKVYGNSNLWEHHNETSIVNLQTLLHIKGVI